MAGARMIRISMRANHPAGQAVAVESPGSLEVLNRPLVLLRRRSRPEGAEVFSLSGFVLLLRVEPVLSRFQFSDHFSLRYAQSNANVAPAPGRGVLLAFGICSGYNGSPL